MAIVLNDNIRVGAGKPSEPKYLNLSNAPYTGSSQVFTQVPLGERHIGLTVNINNTEHWFATGVTNSDLIEKSSASGGTGNIFAVNGLTKIGNTIRLGGEITGNTFLRLRNNADLTISGDSNNAITFQGFDGGLYFNDTTGGGIFFNDTGGGGVYFDDPNGGSWSVNSNGGGISLNDSGAGGIALNDTGGGISIESNNDGDLSYIYVNDNGVDLGMANDEFTHSGTLFCEKGYSVIGASLSGETMSIELLTNVNEISVHSNIDGFKGMEYGADYSANFVDRSIPDVEWVKYWVSANTSGWKQDGQTDLTGAVTIDGQGGYLTFQNNYDFEIINSSGRFRLLGDGGYELIGTNYGIDFYSHVDPSAKGRMRLYQDTLLLGSIPNGQNGTADSQYISLLKFSETEALFRDNRGTKVGLQYYADYSADYTDRSLVDKAWVLSQIGGETGSTGNYWPLSGSASLTGTTVAIVIPSGTTMFFSGDSTNTDFTIANSRINLEALPYSKINLGAGDSGWEIQMQSAGINFNMGTDGGVGVHLGTTNNYLSLSGSSSFSLQAGNAGITAIDGELYGEGSTGLVLNASGGDQARLAMFYGETYEAYVNVASSGQITLHKPNAEIVIEDSGAITFSGDSYGVRIMEYGAMQYLADYSADFEDRSLVDKGYVLAAIATGATGGGYVGDIVTGTSFTAITASQFIGVSAATSSTIYLPASPTTFKPYTVTDILGNAESVNITINGNGNLIQGSSTALIDTDYGSITFLYNGFNWSVIAVV